MLLSQLSSTGEGTVFKVNPFSFDFQVINSDEPPPEEFDCPAEGLYQAGKV